MNEISIQLKVLFSEISISEAKQTRNVLYKSTLFISVLLTSIRFTNYIFFVGKDISYIFNYIFYSILLCLYAFAGIFLLYKIRLFGNQKTVYREKNLITIQVFLVIFTLLIHLAANILLQKI